jgi:hypothetical protein
MYQDPTLSTMAYRIVVSVLEADLSDVGSVPGASDHP